MQRDLFHGELVYLAAEELDVLSDALSRWSRNSEYLRMLTSTPGVLWSDKKIEEFIEKIFDENGKDCYFFSIRLRENDRLIGFSCLMDIEANHAEASIRIGIGEPDSWGKGYGTEALRLLLVYAFYELDLQRVNLVVVAGNNRAKQACFKAGFKLEGRMRLAVLREGQRQDILAMGVLREEWSKDMV